MKGSLIRLIGGILIPSLIVDPSLAAAVAERAKSPAYPLTIPARWGRITDAYGVRPESCVLSHESNTATSARDAGPKTQDPRLVVLIQDLHGHPGVQRNIAEILKQLSRHASWVVRRESRTQIVGHTTHDTRLRTGNGYLTVFVEGAYGPFDVGILRNVQNKWVKKQAVEKFLNDAWLSGSEVAAIESETPMHLWGVDDKTLYLRNLEAFYKASTPSPLSSPPVGRGSSKNVPLPWGERVGVRGNLLLSPSPPSSPIPSTSLGILSLSKDKGEEDGRRVWAPHPHPKHPAWQEYYAIAKQRDIPLAMNALNHIELLEKGMRGNASSVRSPGHVPSSSLVPRLRTCVVRAFSRKNKVGPDFPRLPSSSLPLVALVAGGYHTEGIARIFKANEIPYVVVTPVVDSLGSERAYTNALRELADLAHRNAVGLQHLASRAIDETYQARMRDRFLGVVYRQTMIHARWVSVAQGLLSLVLLASFIAGPRWIGIREVWLALLAIGFLQAVILKDRDVVNDVVEHERQHLKAAARHQDPSIGHYGIEPDGRLGITRAEFARRVLHDEEGNSFTDLIAYLRAKIRGTRANNAFVSLKPSVYDAPQKVRHVALAPFWHELGVVFAVAVRLKMIFFGYHLLEPWLLTHFPELLWSIAPLLFLCVSYLHIYLGIRMATLILLNAMPAVQAIRHYRRHGEWPAWAYSNDFLAALKFKQLPDSGILRFPAKRAAGHRNPEQTKKSEKQPFWAKRDISPATMIAAVAVLVIGLLLLYQLPSEQQTAAILIFSAFVCVVAVIGIGLSKWLAPKRKAREQQRLREEGQKLRQSRRMEAQERAELSHRQRKDQIREGLREALARARDAQTLRQMIDELRQRYARQQGALFEEVYAELRESIQARMTAFPRRDDSPTTLTKPRHPKGKSLNSLRNAAIKAAGTLSQLSEEKDLVRGPVLSRTIPSLLDRICVLRREDEGELDNPSIREPLNQFFVNLARSLIPQHPHWELLEDPGQPDPSALAGYLWREFLRLGNGFLQAEDFVSDLDQFVDQECRRWRQEFEAELPQLRLEDDFSLILPEAVARESDRIHQLARHPGISLWSLPYAEQIFGLFLQAVSGRVKDRSPELRDAGDEWLAPILRRGIESKGASYFSEGFAQACAAQILDQRKRAREQIPEITINADTRRLAIPPSSLTQLRRIHAQTTTNPQALQEGHPRPFLEEFIEHVLTLTLADHPALEGLGRDFRRNAANDLFRIAGPIQIADALVQFCCERLAKETSLVDVRTIQRRALESSHGLSAEADVLNRDRPFMEWRLSDRFQRVLSANWAMAPEHFARSHPAIENLFILLSEALIERFPILELEQVELRLQLRGAYERKQAGLFKDAEWNQWLNRTLTALMESREEWIRRTTCSVLKTHFPGFPAEQVTVVTREARTRLFTIDITPKPELSAQDRSRILGELQFTFGPADYVLRASFLCLVTNAVQQKLAEQWQQLHRKSLPFRVDVNTADWWRSRSALINRRVRAAQGGSEDYDLQVYSLAELDYATRALSRLRAAPSESFSFRVLEERSSLTYEGRYSPPGGIQVVVYVIQIAPAPKTSEPSPAVDIAVQPDALQATVETILNIDDWSLADLYSLINEPGVVSLVKDYRDRNHVQKIDSIYWLAWLYWVERQIRNAQTVTALESAWNHPMVLIARQQAPVDARPCEELYESKKQQLREVTERAWKQKLRSNLEGPTTVIHGILGGDPQNIADALFDIERGARHALTEEERWQNAELVVASAILSALNLLRGEGITIRRVALTTPPTSREPLAWIEGSTLHINANLLNAESARQIFSVIYASIERPGERKKQPGAKPEKRKTTTGADVDPEKRGQRSKKPEPPRRNPDKRVFGLAPGTEAARLFDEAKARGDLRDMWEAVVVLAPKAERVYFEPIVNAVWDALKNNGLLGFLFNPIASLKLIFAYTQTLVKFVKAHLPRVLVGGEWQKPTLSHILQLIGLHFRIAWAIFWTMAEATRVAVPSAVDGSGALTLPLLPESLASEIQDLGRRAGVDVHRKHNEYAYDRRDRPIGMASEPTPPLEPGTRTYLEDRLRWTWPDYLTIPEIAKEVARHLIGATEETHRDEIQVLIKHLRKDVLGTKATDVLEQVITEIERILLPPGEPTTKGWSTTIELFRGSIVKWRNTPGNAAQQMPDSEPEIQKEFQALLEAINRPKPKAATSTRITAPSQRTIVDDLRQFVDDHPDSPMARVLFARTARQTGFGGPAMRPEALAEINRALEIDPRHPQARFEHAVILNEQGQFEAALRDLDQLAVEYPLQVPVHEQRAVALAGVRRYQEAVDLCDRFAVQSTTALQNLKESPALFLAEAEHHRQAGRHGLAEEALLRVPVNSAQGEEAEKMLQALPDRAPKGSDGDLSASEQGAYDATLDHLSELDARGRLRIITDEGSIWLIEVQGMIELHNPRALYYRIDRQNQEIRFRDGRVFRNAGLRQAVLSFAGVVPPKTSYGDLSPGERRRYEETLGHLLVELALGRIGKMRCGDTRIFLPTAPNLLQNIVSLESAWADTVVPTRYRYAMDMRARTVYRGGSEHPVYENGERQALVDFIRLMEHQLDQFFPESRARNARALRIVPERFSANVTRFVTNDLSQDAQDLLVFLLSAFESLSTQFVQNRREADRRDGTAEDFLNTLSRARQKLSQRILLDQHVVSLTRLGEDLSGRPTFFSQFDDPRRQALLWELYQRHGLPEGVSRKEWAVLLFLQRHASRRPHRLLLKAIAQGLAHYLQRHDNRPEANRVRRAYRELILTFDALVDEPPPVHRFEDLGLPPELVRRLTEQVISSTAAGGAWLGHPFYVRYIAGWLEPALTLGIPTVLLACYLTRHMYWQPTPTLWHFVIALFSGLIIASVSSISFRRPHLWIRGREIYESPEVRRLTYETAIAGFMLGLALAWPGAISWFSFAPSLPLLLLLMDHRRTNRRAIELRVSPPPSRRRKAVHLTASLAALVMCVTIPWLGTLFPIVDLKIRYFDFSPVATAAQSRYATTKLAEQLTSEEEKDKAVDLEFRRGWRQSFQATLSEIESAQSAEETFQKARKLGTLVENLDPLSLEFATIQSLEKFLAQPVSLPVPSLAARDEVRLAREALWNAIKEKVKRNRHAEHPFTAAHIRWIAQKHVRLLDYKESVSHPDPSFPTHTGFDEATMFTHYVHQYVVNSVREWQSFALPEKGMEPAENDYQTIRQFIVLIKNEIERRARTQKYAEERKLFAREVVSEPYQDPIVLIVGSLLSLEEYHSWQSWRAFERRLTAARTEPIHQVPIRLVPAVEELRRLPKEFWDALEESSHIHGVPVEALGAYPFQGEGMNYGLRTSLMFLGLRQKRSVIGRSASWLGRHLPRSADRIFIPRAHLRWKDFLGASVGGKNTMGTYQIRPAHVSRYQLFERFGIDAAHLSDRQISWLLLDPKYNVEAYAAWIKGAANEVEELRRLAVQVERLKANGRADLAKMYKDKFQSYYDDFAKESRDWLKGISYGIPFTTEFFAQLPAQTALGPEGWRLCLLHPLYYAKFAHSAVPTNQLSFLSSGVLDDKPLRFTEVDSPADVQKVCRCLSHGDGKLREAAKETLRDLAVHSKSPAIRAEAQKALKENRISLTTSALSPGAFGLVWNWLRKLVRPLVALTIAAIGEGSGVSVFAHQTGGALWALAVTICAYLIGHAVLGVFGPDWEVLRWRPRSPLLVGFWSAYRTANLIAFASLFAFVPAAFHAPFWVTLAAGIIPHFLGNLDFVLQRQGRDSFFDRKGFWRLTAGWLLAMTGYHVLKPLALSLVVAHPGPIVAVGMTAFTIGILLMGWHPAVLCVQFLRSKVLRFRGISSPTAPPRRLNRKGKWWVLIFLAAWIWNLTALGQLHPRYVSAEAVRQHIGFDWFHPNDLFPGVPRVTSYASLQELPQILDQLRNQSLSDDEMRQYLKDLRQQQFYNGNPYFQNEWFCPWSDHLISLNPEERKAILHSIMDFISQEQSIGKSSFAVRSQILLLKESLLKFLMKAIEKKGLSKKEKKTLIAFLARLQNYQDKFQQDSDFASFYSRPLSTLLTQFIQMASHEWFIYRASRVPDRDMAAYAASIAKVPPPLPVSKTRIQLKHILSQAANGSKSRTQFEKDLAEFQRLRDHPQEIRWTQEQREAIDHVRKLLEPYLPFIQETAEAYDLPPDLLATAIITHVALKWYTPLYTLKGGIETMTVFPNTLVSKFAFLASLLPPPLRNHRVPNYWTHFAAGVVAGGRPTLGLAGIRSSRVRYFQPWKRRFGVDVSQWSDNKINFYLLNPQWNIEALGYIVRDQLDRASGLQEKGLFRSYPPVTRLTHDASLLEIYHPYWGPDWVADFLRSAGFNDPPPLLPSPPQKKRRIDNLTFDATYADVLAQETPAIHRLVLATGLFTKGKRRRPALGLAPGTEAARAFDEAKARGDLRGMWEAVVALAPKAEKVYFEPIVNAVWEALKNNGLLGFFLNPVATLKLIFAYVQTLVKFVKAHLPRVLVGGEWQKPKLFHILQLIGLHFRIAWAIFWEMAILATAKVGGFALEGAAIGNSSFSTLPFVKPSRDHVKEAGRRAGVDIHAWWNEDAFNRSDVPVGMASESAAPPEPGTHPPRDARPRIHWLLRVWAWFYGKTLSQLVTVRGLEHLPQSDSYLIAGNHVSFGTDGVFIATELPRRGYPLPRFVVDARQIGKAERILVKLSRGIQRQPGGGTVNRMVEALREEGTVVGIFPSGAPRIRRKLAVRDMEPGVARASIQAGVPIIPFAISGNIFLRATLLALIRSFFNWSRNKRQLAPPFQITITFGPPVYPPRGIPLDEARAEQAIQRVLVELQGSIENLLGIQSERENTPNPAPIPAPDEPPSWDGLKNVLEVWARRRLFESNADPQVLVKALDEAWDATGSGHHEEKEPTPDQAARRRRALRALDALLGELAKEWDAHSLMQQSFQRDIEVENVTCHAVFQVRLEKSPRIKITIYGENRAPRTDFLIGCDPGEGGEPHFDAKDVSRGKTTTWKPHHPLNGLWKDYEAMQDFIHRLLGHPHSWEKPTLRTALLLGVGTALGFGWLGHIVGAPWVAVVPFSLLTGALAGLLAARITRQFSEPLYRELAEGRHSGLMASFDEVQAHVNELTRHVRSQTPAVEVRTLGRKQQRERIFLTSFIILLISLIGFLATGRWWIPIALGPLTGAGLWRLLYVAPPETLQIETIFTNQDRARLLAQQQTDAANAAIYQQQIQDLAEKASGSAVPLQVRQALETRPVAYYRDTTGHHLCLTWSAATAPDFPLQFGIAHDLFVAQAPGILRRFYERNGSRLAYALLEAWGHLGGIASGVYLQDPGLDRLLQASGFSSLGRAIQIGRNAFARAWRSLIHPEGSVGRILQKLGERMWGTAAPGTTADETLASQTTHHGLWEGPLGFVSWLNLWLRYCWRRWRGLLPSDEPSVGIHLIRILGEQAEHLLAFPQNRQTVCQTLARGLKERAQALGESIQAHQQEIDALRSRIHEGEALAKLQRHVDQIRHRLQHFKDLIRSLKWLAFPDLRVPERCLAQHYPTEDARAQAIAADPQTILDPEVYQEPSQLPLEDQMRSYLALHPVRAYFPTRSLIQFIEDYERELDRFLQAATGDAPLSPFWLDGLQLLIDQAIGRTEVADQFVRQNPGFEKISASGPEALTAEESQQLLNVEQQIWQMAWPRSQQAAAPPHLWTLNYAGARFWKPNARWETALNQLIQDQNQAFYGSGTKQGFYNFNLMADNYRRRFGLTPRELFLLRRAAEAPEPPKSDRSRPPPTIYPSDLLLLGSPETPPPSHPTSLGAASDPGVDWRRMVIRILEPAFKVLGEPMRTAARWILFGEGRRPPLPYATTRRLYAEWAKNPKTELRAIQSEQGQRMKELLHAKRLIREKFRKDRPSGNTFTLTQGFDNKGDAWLTLRLESASWQEWMRHRFGDNPPEALEIEWRVADHLTSGVDGITKLYGVYFPLGVDRQAGKKALRFGVAIERHVFDRTGTGLLPWTIDHELREIFYRALGFSEAHADKRARSDHDNKRGIAGWHVPGAITTAEEQDTAEEAPGACSVSVSIPSLNQRIRRFLRKAHLPPSGRTKRLRQAA